MGNYRLLIKASAAEEIENLPTKEIRRQVVARVQLLAKNPRPPGSEKLSGSTQIYRVRQGVFRIIYSILDKEMTVTVVKVAHRKEVYR